MLVNPPTTSPVLNVTLGDGHQITARLPFLVNKFTESVDMPPETFKKVWDDITQNRPDSF